MKVRDWMRRDVAGVPESTAVTDLARMMADSRASAVPVVDGQGHVIGIVTEEDLIVKHAQLHFPVYLALLGAVLPLESRRSEREIERALATTAGDLMGSHVVTVPPDADVDEAATLMVDEKIGAIPVIEGGRLAGLITRADIVKLLAVEETA